VKRKAAKLNPTSIMIVVNGRLKAGTEEQAGVVAPVEVECD
jgi:hypothetical protein